MKEKQKEKGVITHIYVDGKWKKASVPERKRRGAKTKDAPSISGSGLPAIFDFPPMKNEKKDDSLFWESLAKVLSK